jgi:AraC-like DNA-binding protein
MTSSIRTAMQLGAAGREQPTRGPAAWELTELRHQSLTAGDTLVPSSAPVWLLVLDGGLVLETASGSDALSRGDAVFLDDRTAYRLTADIEAEVAVAALRPVLPPAPVPSPMIVRDFAGRHVGVAELVRTCPLDSGCHDPSVFAPSYGGLIGASMTAAWWEAQTGDERSSASPDPAVVAIVAAVADRPADAWTVDRMARLVHLSRSALTQRFRRTLGLSPVRVLREIRMQHAREMLADGSWSVEQVGYDVGYGSPAAFSRAFSGHHRVAPQAWRDASAARQSGHPEQAEEQASSGSAHRSEEQRHLSVVKVDERTTHDRPQRDRDLESGHLERQR